MGIEQMSDFFTARVDRYEAQMLNNVEGCKNGYEKMAQLLPGEAHVQTENGQVVDRPLADVQTLQVHFLFQKALLK